jgi:serine/threonine protein phosphatase PrpC
MFDIAYDQIIGSREEQQDYFATFSLDDGELVILADGMGGYSGGKLASSTVVKSVVSTLKECKEDIKSCFKKSLFASQNELIQKINLDDTLAQMGTTLIMAYVTSEKITWLSIGDSLIYLFRENQLYLLNELHCSGNLLTSAVTSKEITLYEYSSHNLKKDDILIVSSDGLNSLEQSEIVKCLDRNISKEIIKNLFQMIEQKNLLHQDNTTIIALQRKQYE